ncbi:hypothetical protein SteCoe_21276 [Stentor coeruleus]|uniref:Uncharacterized protein n=1 Tax=Stentor coeruleus TaxID=5963 RepID=A0A1R2BPW0_9CILI|nr:hypothetical protein SteCoe_21276 [Stentor coeruleus]
MEYPTSLNILNIKNNKKKFIRNSQVNFTSKLSEKSSSQLPISYKNLHKSPGPGAYSIISKISGPAFSLSGKPKSRVESLTPGPGTYLIPPRRVVCPKFSPARERPIKVPDKIGPGSYTPFYEYSTPKWRFGDSKRQEYLISESPGPGAYSVPSNFSKKAFSIYPKRKLQESSPTPGPGAYYPKHPDKSLKFSLSPRLDYTAKEDIPGPGTYSPNLLLGLNFPR